MSTIMEESVETQFKQLVLANQSDKKSMLMTKDEYNAMIDELKVATWASSKTSRQYYILSRYEILPCGDEEKLIRRRKGRGEEPVYFVHLDDMFDILKCTHIATGHGGRDKMAKALTMYANITRDAIATYKMVCVECQNKRKRSLEKEALKPTHGKEFGTRGQVDLVDMHSKPHGPHNWIMVYQDIVTKYCVLRPLTSNCPGGVAYELLDIFLQFGAPQILQSGNGSEFAASVISELKQLWPDLMMVQGTPHHPQSHQPLERLSCDVKDRLLAWLGANKSTDWPFGLKFIQFQKNSTYHAGIQQSPYEALFGMRAREGLRSTGFPMDVLEALSTEEDLNTYYESLAQDTTAGSEDAADSPPPQPVPDLVERMVEGGEDGPSTSGDASCPSVSSPLLASSSSQAVTLITTTSTATRVPVSEPTPSVEVQKQYEPKKLHADCLEEGPVIRETETSNIGTVQGLAGPYLLKKETHCTSILDQLLRDETYADVTLTAEGQNIRAHRVILSLASNYFRHVLSRDANVQSVVVLRDVKFAQLQNIIHFIYTGETTVDASQLDGFMKTAELLEINSLSDGHKALGSRGLLNTHSNSETLVSSPPDQRTLASKRTRPGGSETSAKTRRISGGVASASSSDSREERILDPMSNVKVEPTDEICRRATGSKRRLESIDDETGTNGEPSEVEEVSQSESLGMDKEGGSLCNTTSNAFSHDDSASTSPGVNTDFIAAPGRCPYCPHLSQQFMDVAMMRHLLVMHPCKPAFPCDVCWRVYVKRNHFKAHQRVCSSGEKRVE